ncbi:MAG: ImmA/IrrE family metallo-endopeptidase [Fibrobacter sp.]|uniref:ImmA/IrrE family metallo-endopeptidase n=1 Tax=Fibrobacter sp. TaxID=35828 RepID=UPI0025BF53FA|nr:ImmA/IrrE family metallo-endopeptidase [Fibrobacter sp.]MBQ7080245.1 ImmA/IrrE family metallo-endopeptidase [Fibrobacter sp.]
MSEIQECGWGKAVIRNFANKVREVSGFDPKETVDFKDIVEIFGGTVSEDKDVFFGDTIDVRGKLDFTIKLHPLATTERQRFTLAHELGHYFLHSKQGAVPLKAFRLGTSMAEQEANYFAAELLMPEDMFKADFRSLPETLNQDEKISRMAQMYHVSFTAANVRLSSLSLI